MRFNEEMQAIDGRFRVLMIVAFLFVCLLVVPSVRADEIRPLNTAEFMALKARYAGQPFLVTLWSVDCPPCREELAMLGGLKRQQPDFPLILIATDSIEKRADAAYILEHYGLADIESWMFADAFVERLRHSIDPGWYGELPRSYFYDAAQNFTSHSGVLTRDMLEKRFR